MRPRAGKTYSGNGGRILIDCLVDQGVEHVFCVPGESYLPALDALADAPIRLVVCRQEGGAAMMAEAAGKLTGRPGVCFVTRGPGATNAAPGIHIAAQDSTPMILFIGQVAQAFREREAFQEVDYRALFGGMAKWVVEVNEASRLPEIVSRAFHTATAGRPGPVVVALPEDVLGAIAEVPAVEPWRPVETNPGAAEMAELEALLRAARRPVAILGGSRWDAEACAAFARFAERLALPVATSFRRQMLFDAYHSCYAGDVSGGINPKLKARIQSADLVLLVGARLGELPSSDYTLIDVPQPSQTLVHVHPGAEELGRVYRPDLAIHASPKAFAAALDRLEPPVGERVSAEAGQAHADFLSWTEEASSNPGPVQLGPIMRHLREALPADAIVTNGAGNYSGWVHRFHRYRGFGTQLAPISGSMGYGTPAAVAAKLLHPERAVVAFAGDGCFLMNGQEFATAVQYELPIMVIIINNGLYGTIRMHQEMHFPGRVCGTTLRNPDFAAYARAFGGHGEIVQRTEDFIPAFERARASGLPSIIEVRIDPEAISPGATLTALREKGQAQARKPAMA
jgi:acetolactate synthase-1/2/3 large subunit